MGKKVYAIREGFDKALNQKIENKIVNTWAECLNYVKGVKGAKYKSFESIDDAYKYLEDSSVMMVKGDGKYPEDGLHVYVDGSYNLGTKEYSYGLVALEHGTVMYIDSGKGKSDSKKDIRQIAGELKASVKAAEYALNNGYKKVVIFHDYEGVRHHATGFWERREESSIQYYEKMQSLMNKGLEVLFVKVDSHTGDLFNELADEKCKECLGIKSDKVVDTYLKSNKIIVLDEEVRKQIQSLAPLNSRNILIKGESESIESTNEEIENKCILAKKKVDNNVDIDDFLKRYKENSSKALKSLKSKEKDKVIEYLMDKIGS